MLAIMRRPFLDIELSFMECGWSYGSFGPLFAVTWAVDRPKQHHLEDAA